jgi:serine/threonine protein kinase
VQLADALGAGHGQGIHHLDLQPDNIEVSRRGRAKLLGFGLSDWARRTAASDSAPGTTADEGLYRSPEQHRGDSGDHRSDLFSLGLVLYRLLAGQPPSPGGSRLRPGEVNDRVPAELDEIVERATAAAVEGRYQSAVSLAAELRSVAAVLDVRTGDKEPPRFVPTAPVAVGGARRWTAVVPLAVLLLVTLWWLSRT